MKRDGKVLKDVACHIRSDAYANGRSFAFENMVWKSAETVAFAVKSPWAVAWYCSASWPANQRARTASDNKANILRTQIVDGYNVAYNALALRNHNEKRALHKDTPPMTLYGAAAREIQKVMDSDKFAGKMGLAQARPKEFRDCAESVYEMTDDSKVGLLVRGEGGKGAEKDFATEYWYNAGDKAIDYSTGRAKAG